MKKLLVPLAMLLCAVTTQAQKKFTDPEKAQVLQKQYSDDKVVATKSHTAIQFKIEDNLLVAHEAYQVDLISLNSAVDYYKNVYYNDNIELINGNAKYTSGRGRLTCNKLFGNYEVDNIFYSDAKVGHYSFTMLHEATEVTFSAEKKYKDPKYLTKVYFKDKEPTLLRTISFTIPTHTTVELVEMNFDGYDITKEESEKDGNKHIEYTCRQLDEMEQESNSPGLLHSTPHIVVVTKNYQVNGETKNIIATTDDLYNWYHSLAKSVDVDHSAYELTVKELTEGTQTDEEKIRNIYYWIQENIKYIAFEDGIAGFKPEAPQTVYNNRYGDCKGMAILTKSMLEVAGIDARLTWIGTSKIPYNYDLPSLAVDNHMICTAFANDKMYVLDATEKYIALNKIAERIQGKEMLIEDGDNYMRKMVPLHTADENLVARTENITIKDHCLVGEGNIEINGETKKSILYLSNNSKVEDKAKLYDFLSVAESTNEDLVKVNNAPDTERDKPLKIDYNFRINNKVNEFDKELFVELDWEKSMSRTDIEKDRLSAFDFGRKIMNQTTKKLSIPKGYKLSHLPEKISYESNNINVNVNYQLKGGVIIYTNSITIAKGKILPDEFETWNTIVKQLNTFYNDQIILKKI
ncbi:transglutaminase-like domain-containing protein [Carboxylicivirga taeanensis]|uniref:transglutaminase-like domain-containing protein n=1 Tax=Carboxylicivirga taeanensis TaxID=1416875 RepID=UPI003F6E2BBA